MDTLKLYDNVSRENKKEMEHVILWLVPCQVQQYLLVGISRGIRMDEAEAKVVSSC
jgi:hypothetical protein